VTTYTVVDARSRTVLPASDAVTAAPYRRIFDDKRGQGSHRVVAAEPEAHISACAPPFLVAPLFIAASILLTVVGASPVVAGTAEHVSVAPWECGAVAKDVEAGVASSSAG
jgi:hypothetical protein